MSLLFWNILKSCREQARKHIDLRGIGEGVQGIPKDSILIRRPPYRREQREIYIIDPKPALVFTGARTLKIPPGGGNNCDADYYFPVLAQLIDTCDSSHEDDREKTWWSWQDNLIGYFNQGNLRGEVFSSDGSVTLATAEDVDVFDERQFYIYHECVAVVPIVFKVRKPHDPKGRT